MLRVAVAGCGAVTQIYGAPALARLSGRGLVSVTALYDPDPSAVEAVRALLPTANPAESFTDMLGTADLALIASPASVHFEQSLEALRKGLHVFCEKPLALSEAEARELVSTATQCRRQLAVGLIRRQLPSTKAIKELLDRPALGRLLRVEWFEGGPFRWPVASPSYFSAEVSGGGVLQDIGTHALDLLSWWCGTPNLLSYEDDAMGGVEANALIRLDCNGAKVRMRLSRDWAQPNRVVIVGERGSIGWNVNEGLDVELTIDAAPSTNRPLPPEPPDGPPDFVWAYTAQLEELVHAIRQGRPPATPVQAGVEVCALVEDCFRSRRLMAMPWLAETDPNRVMARGNSQ
jgi:predicted dehydrogenase